MADAVTLDVLAAGHGDSLVVTYGPANDRHRLLVDGGPAGTYEDGLRRYLTNLRVGDRHFDLLIVTHVDTDHIDGILVLLQEADRLGVSFGEIWFNGWPQLSEERAPAHGMFLDELLDDERFRSAVNAAYDGGPVLMAEDKRVMLPGGAELWVLSPDDTTLVRLRDLWEQAITREGLGDEEEQRRRLVDRLARRKAYQPPDIEDETGEGSRGLASEGSDPSVPNGSSIAVLLTQGTKCVLLTGDAHADVLADGLRRLRDARGPGRPTIDVVKLPHHGSIANLSGDLVELMACDRYVVSTNGDRYGHPDREAIELLAARTASSPTVYFNYLSKTTKRWADPGEQARLGITAVYRDGDWLTVEV